MKAFPVPRYVNSSGETFDPPIQGMDLRDYFAIKVLAAYQSNPEFYKDLKKGVFHANDAVSTAYDWADAMLEERDK